MKSRLILAALLVGATALVSGCGSGDLPAPSTLDAVNPQPAGAGEIAAPPQAEGDNSCDSEATLRPNAVPPRPGAMPPGSPMAAIVANGRLRVGVDQNTYLFGFRDPGTGQLQGFDIDIAREIAKDILGDPNKIELRSVTAAERISALHDKKVDLIVRTFSATCERRREVDFSAVYYRSAQRILAPRESGISTGADLAGKRVCVARGTTAAAPLFAMAKRPTVIGVTNWTDCLVALQQGHVDAVSGDDPILFGLVAQDRNLQVVGEPIGTGAYAVGAPKGSDELVRFVNGVLERMRTDGTWQRIYTDKLSVLGPSPGQPVARYVG
ncbi:putative ABC transporter substrate-binding protein [Nocardia brasiliensis NBRC 14402]|uniref:glutamate ABC transporter substrate-binding protein n=1 Tax=Nocardia brasiliensis TaxID=37326 RepID=UPI0003029CBE|nr:glutamate ABC transporter substrate-binding protein [Nocardia brasiliensis]ASF06868.1 ABC transporter substrate-binding protein [Nocardia brasiliensis]GAJ82228.1 putative ABC transporter substrate-binding protein [Nocardia brasiliensis NBRC 14402]SUB47917.1 PEB1 [Nocardia brasiliensis]